MHHLDPRPLLPLPPLTMLSGPPAPGLAKCHGPLRRPALWGAGGAPTLSALSIYLLFCFFCLARVSAIARECPSLAFRPFFNVCFDNVFFNNVCFDNVFFNVFVLMYFLKMHVASHCSGA